MLMGFNYGMQRDVLDTWQRFDASYYVSMYLGYTPVPVTSLYPDIVTEVSMLGEQS